MELVPSALRATAHPYFNNKIKPALTPAPESEVIISREKAMDFKKWLGK